MDILILIGYIYTAVLGLLFGSFLNVCILRIPAGESVVSGASHCPLCGRRLRPYELIPVFSWLIQRGRCRGCGARISAQYVIIELSNMLLWLLAARFCGFTLSLPLCCALLSALLGLSVIDARTQEIPFCFNVFIGIIALLRTGVSVYESGISAALPHVIGAVAVSLPLYLIYVISGKRAVGGGDVKLMLVTGLFHGWQLTVLGFFAGCFLGAVIHSIRMKTSKAGRVLALGPYLSAGLTLSLLFGQTAIVWYLQSFIFL